MYYSNTINTGDYVFLGDSLTEGFDLKKYFSDTKLVNRGVSGDMTVHALYRLNEIIKARPARIYLLIGINDILQGVDLKVLLSNYLQIIIRITNEDQNCKIIIQSILPVNETRLPGISGLNIDIYKFNNLLRKYCSENKLRFIDLHSDFLNNQGEMDTVYTFDGIHLSDAGYANWTEIIKKHFQRS